MNKVTLKTTESRLKIESEIYFNIVHNTISMGLHYCLPIQRHGNRRPPKDRSVDIIMMPVTNTDVVNYQCSHIAFRCFISAHTIHHHGTIV